MLTLGLEYFTPEINLPDILAEKAFQLIPDITARFEKTVKWGSLQLSGILPIIKGKSSEGTIVYKPGWGVSFSTVIDSWAGGKWHLQATSFTPNETYYQGDNFRVNTFWSVVEGARIGAEYIHAIRRDKGGAKGIANRVNLLFYYDF